MKRLHHLVCIKKNVHHGHIQIFILNWNEFMKSGQETNICIQGYLFFLPKLGLYHFKTITCVDVNNYVAIQNFSGSTQRE